MKFRAKIIKNEEIYSEGFSFLKTIFMNILPFLVVHGNREIVLLFNKQKNYQQKCLLINKKIIPLASKF